MGEENKMNLSNGMLWVQNMEDGRYVKVGETEFADIQTIGPKDLIDDSHDSICLNRDLSFETTIKFTPRMMKKFRRALMGWRNKGHMREKNLMRWYKMYERLTWHRVRMIDTLRDINRWEDQISYPIDISETPCTDFTEWLWWMIIKTSGNYEYFDDYKKRKAARQNRSKNRIR